MNPEQRREIICSHRKKRGWTQLELATKAGVSPSYIQKLEGEDSRDKRSSELRKVALALGLEETSLLDDSDVVIVPRDELDELRKSIGTKPAIAKAIVDRWVIGQSMRPAAANKETPNKGQKRDD